MGREGKEDKRVTFPAEYDDCKSFNSLPTLRKVKFDVGSSIRSLQFFMSDGTKSD